jgi:YhcH/YjgK/YiaL family protein
MIIDKIKNAPLYYGLNKRLETALRFLQGNELSKMAPGKYEIDGDKIYALIHHYETTPKEKGLWEAHRRYIDVQYVAEGSELMGYANIGDMKVSKEYDNGEDYLLFDGCGDYLTVEPGTFVILTPEDAHMPGTAIAETRSVTKVVVKVLSDLI